MLYMVYRETTNSKLIPLISTSFEEITMRLRWDEEKIKTTNRLLIDSKIITADGYKMVINTGSRILFLSGKKSFRYALLKEINNFPAGDSVEWVEMSHFLQQIKSKIEALIKEEKK